MEVFSLVIVGRGSAAAYYLARADLKQYESILIVGEDDPWLGRRGHSGNPSDATLKINQPAHLLEHLSETIEAYSETLVDRVAWAKKNAAVLAKSTGEIRKATVVDITEAILPGANDLWGFKINLEGQQSVYGYKVVVCAGTGGHRVPDKLKEARKNYPTQVLDLDEFASLGPRDLSHGPSVVVIGENAAIDAVHKALNYHCKIDWLMALNDPEAPPMLATQPLMLAAWKDQEKHKLRVFRYESYVVAPFGVGEVRLNVTLRPKMGQSVPQPATRYASGRYCVYGIGPSGETTGLINSKIMAKLKPITDGTRALNPNSRQSTILGYEVEGTGLKNGFEVFGAMSGQIGRLIQKSDDRMTQIESQVKETRAMEGVFVALQHPLLPPSPWLRESLRTLALKDRGELFNELQREIGIAGTAPGLKALLELLANQILAYHTAHAYKQMGANDPNSLEKFRELLNNVTTTLPKGAVGDYGQLTSINVALGAYATMRGPLPKYMPKQVVTGVTGVGKEARLQGYTTPGDINFNLDNAQNIAIYVCASFPNIPTGEANAFVETVLSKRHNSAIGFTDSEVAQFKLDLARKERDAMRKTLT